VASGAAITRSIASDGCPVRLPSKLIGELRPSAERRRGHKSAPRLVDRDSSVELAPRSIPLFYAGLHVIMGLSEPLLLNISYVVLTSMMTSVEIKMLAWTR